MKRTLPLPVAAVVLSVLIPTAIAVFRDAQLRSELDTAMDVRSRTLEREVADLKQKVDASQRALEGLEAELVVLRDRAASLAASQAETATRLAQVIAGAQALSSWQVIESGDGARPAADVRCEHGEVVMSLAPADAKPRVLSLSAGGIRLASQTRVVELSERGIVIYENVEGERLGKVIWRTGSAAAGPGEGIEP